MSRGREGEGRGGRDEGRRREGGREGGIGREVGGREKCQVRIAGISFSWGFQGPV